MAGGLGGTNEARDRAALARPYDASNPSDTGSRYDPVSGGVVNIRPPDQPYQEPRPHGSAQHPSFQFPQFGSSMPGGGGGSRGGGSAGGGGGGGGTGYSGTVINFDPSQFRQDIQPNPYQTEAYDRMRELYQDVPDYMKRALAEGRTAATGTFNEVRDMVGGVRGFGPGSGLTTSQMLKAQQYANRNILGGQLDAAERTFKARADLAGQMGGLGTNIGVLMDRAFMGNVNAYNALANYGLGADANAIANKNADTARMQAELAPMQFYWNMALDAMQFL